MSAEGVAVTVQSEPRYQMFPDADAYDYGTTRESIRQNGQLEPIVVDEEGYILDGHQRARICAELGIDPKVDVLEGLSEDEKREYAFWVNYARRHLTPSARRVVIRRVEARLRENPFDSDRRIAALLRVDHKTVGLHRGRLEASGEIPSTRRPHSRYEDESDTSAAERTPEDAADHRSMCWFELVIGYPAPSEKMRMRAGLPYPREQERREWPSKRCYLASPAPKTTAEAQALVKEMAETVLREIVLRRPLATMRAT